MLQHTEWHASTPDEHAADVALSVHIDKELSAVAAFKNDEEMINAAREQVLHKFKVAGAQ